MPSFGRNCRPADPERFLQGKRPGNDVGNARLGRSGQPLRAKKTEMFIQPVRQDRRKDCVVLLRCRDDVSVRTDVAWSQDLP